MFNLAVADAAVNPNGVGAHTLGIGQGLTNTVTGLIDAVSNPLQTLKGLGNLALLGASQGNPATALAIDNALGTNSFETGAALSNSIEQGANNLINGNGLERGEVIGEIAGAVIGTKGANVATKAVSTGLKATRAASKFGGVLKSAQLPNKNGLTNVGRALQKHAGREGSAFGDIKFSHKTGNQQGLNTLNSIMKSKNLTTQPGKNGGTLYFDNTMEEGLVFQKVETSMGLEN